MPPGLAFEASLTHSSSICLYFREAELLKTESDYNLGEIEYVSHFSTPFVARLQKNVTFLREVDASYSHVPSQPV